MNSLFRSDGLSIPSLYVKSATGTYSIRSIFQTARYMSPCLLIFEDIDTIVTKDTRSYFFNEVDVSSRLLSLPHNSPTQLSPSPILTVRSQGLESNDGIFMVASTNHLDQLDAGLSSRPSRFDRKYLFPNPSEGERNLYCRFWRERLKKKKVEVEFPMRICPAVAMITDGFSFAYMQEAFVATLLAIAQGRSDALDDEEVRQAEGDGGDNDLDEYELWRELKKTIKALRDDMSNDTPGKSSTNDNSFSKELALEMETQAPTGDSEPPVGQFSIPLRPAASGCSERPETSHARGTEIRVDSQGVPIITEENAFIHSCE